MTPKPRSPMPIRVEIWDTKNSGLDALAPRDGGLLHTFAWALVTALILAFLVLLMAAGQ